MSGIYTITNTNNGRVYVGSSGNIAARWSLHRAELRGGRHFNKALQRDWIALGESCFTIKVVMECPVAILAEVENQWIRSLSETADVYNVKAYSSRGTNSRKCAPLDPAYVNMRQAAALLGVSYNTARSMIRRAKLQLYGDRDHRQILTLRVDVESLRAQKARDRIAQEDTDDK